MDLNNRIRQSEFQLSLVRIAEEAGNAILEIYNSKDFDTRLKDDDSPVTAADLASNNVLIRRLDGLIEDVKVVSEEDKDSISIPKKHDTFWLIDPLDGTKEFINRNDQFTVNIALIHQQHSIFGVVTVPALNTAYWGGPNLGSWKKLENESTSIKVSEPATPVRVVASKSHLNDATKEFIGKLGDHQLVQAGSSLKFCRLAEGSADIYPRLAPTCEWDTAAAQAILEGAGGIVMQQDGQPVVYGKDEILNPYFIAYGGYRGKMA